MHPDHKAITEVVRSGVFSARLPKWDEVAVAWSPPRPISILPWMFGGGIQFIHDQVRQGIAVLKKTRNARYGLSAFSILPTNSIAYICR